MDRRTEKTLALAGGMTMVWLLVDAALVRQTHLLVLPAVLPYLAVALLVCGFVYLRARLHRRAEEERRDRELARTERPESALFDQDEKKFEPFSLGRSRQQFERWVVPTFSLALALVQAWWAWRIAQDLDHPHNPPAQRLIAASFLAGQTFLLFLFSRYLLGLSRHRGQQLLRGPGVALGVACFASLLATAATIFAEASYPPADRLATLALIVGLAIMAVEIFLGFLWELYRPRRADDLNRSYESRLAGLFTDPAGWVRDIGGALDYQFGFKVSDTWLYRFLENALLPLIIFQLVILYLLSAVVFLGPDEEGIVERFGRPRAAGWHLESGIHFKLPWPFEVVRRFPAKRVLAVEIGFKERDSKIPSPDANLILWNVPHFASEDQFLVASRDTASGTGDSVSVPVNLLSFNVRIEYRIRDIRQYAYQAADPAKTLEQIAYRTLTLTAASRDLFDVMSQGRGEMADLLRANLQRKADSLRLGVDVLFVALDGVHPPTSIADAFQSVIGATEEREASILKSRAAANKLLPVANADAERLKQEAAAYNIRRQAVAQAEAGRFLKRLDAYHKSPTVFRSRQYLSSLKEALTGARKYVVATSPSSEVIILNFEEKMAPDLFDVGPNPTKKP